MTEEDEYYQDDVREPPESVVARARAVLVKIFEDRDRECKDIMHVFTVEDLSLGLIADAYNWPTVISVTAHGGWINAFLTAVGRERFALSTGGEWSSGLPELE